MPAIKTQKNEEGSASKSANVSFTVRVTLQQHKALEALAAIEKMTLSELMRQIIQDGIVRGLDPNRVAQKLQQQQEEYAELQQEIAAGV